MRIDFILIFIWSVLWFLTGRLYSLRGHSIVDSFTVFGFGISIATFSYKVQALILVAFFVLNFVKGQWVSPFIETIVGFILSLIIGRVLVKTNIIVGFSNAIPPKMMSVYGILMLILQIFLIIYLV